MLTFSERLQRRHQLWWNVGQVLPDLSAHRFLDRVRLRSRHSPLEKWSCCDHWQRCLLNKWNSREFAALHGAQVPELYWSGRDAAAMPIDSFPEYFAIRPAWGTATRGTHVVSGTTDIVTGVTYKDRKSLKDVVLKERGRFSVFPLLVEEFMTTPEGKYESSIEYKFYMFGKHAGPIMTVQRRDGAKFLRHYTPNWEIINDSFRTSFPLDDPLPKPQDFDRMIEISTRLGGAFGTFVRVDLYLTSKGIYFGEFSSIPAGYRDFTPFADEYLGRSWEEHIPDKV
jgi:hypothetical protein